MILLRLSFNTYCFTCTILNFRDFYLFSKITNLSVDYHIHNWKSYTSDVGDGGRSQTKWKAGVGGSEKFKNLSTSPSVIVHQSGWVKKGQKSVHVICEPPHG